MSLDAAVVGLGNPGQQYVRNRHNVGYRAAERVARDLQFRFTRKGFHCLLAGGSVEGKSVLLAKPQTFMNASGQAVEALVRFYGIPLNRLLICCDDIDLPLGTLRLRALGGSGGQKGVQSIISALASEEFPRLRIGIGRPPGEMDAASYVLQDFASQEETELEEIVERAAGAVELFIRFGLQAAMNRYNGGPDATGSPRAD